MTNKCHSSKDLSKKVPSPLRPILVVVFQVNLGSQVADQSFFDHLFQKIMFEKPCKWSRFLMGWMTFLSPNQQCRSTDPSQGE